MSVNMRAYKVTASIKIDVVIYPDDDELDDDSISDAIEDSVRDDLPHYWELLSIDDVEEATR